MRHMRGDGTAKDPAKAATYFQRACDRGDARGCFNLGDSYQAGKGVPKDAAKAAAFYQRACDGREKGGCSELALSYLSGNGVKQSEAKAAIYADRSCTLNSPFGCAILGMVYADGVEGYPQDLAKAEELLFDACHKGSKYTEEPDEAARLACPAYTKITGEPACVTVGSTSTGEVRKHCFDAQAGWVMTVVQDAASPVAKVAAPTTEYELTCNITRGSNSETTTYVVRDFKRVFIVNNKTGRLEEISVDDNALIVSYKGFSYVIIISDFESFSTTEVNFERMTLENSRGYLGSGNSANYSDPRFPGIVNNIYKGSCSQLVPRK